MKMSFLPDIVKKGWTEEEVFVICFESERERNRRRLQAIVCDHHLKQVKEFLLYNELTIWRRENGFDRVMEGEESCFPGHLSLPPTPQEYYASLWCEVNALRDAISYQLSLGLGRRIPWTNYLRNSIMPRSSGASTSDVARRHRRRRR